MIFMRRSMRSRCEKRFMTVFGTAEACWASRARCLIVPQSYSTVSPLTGHGGTALLGQAEFGGARVRNRVRYCVWLVLGPGATLLAGCVSPYYSAFPPPVYAPPPFYGAQPSYGALPPPVPLYPTLQPLPAPAPEAEAPAAAPEPAPESMVSPGLSPGLSPALPSGSVPEPALDSALQSAPDSKAPEAIAPSGRPATQAGPAADAPLQGFRPMRGQTRPGA